MKTLLILVVMLAVGVYYFNQVTTKPKVSLGECKLELGKEYNEPNEKTIIQELVDTITHTLEETYTQKNLFVKRDAHPKAHGCVDAKFTVAEDVPEEFRHGVFANLKSSYKTVIRFSNGQFSENHDLVPDSRGIGVKLIGVPGKKVMPDEINAQTQDFVGANGPAFFVTTAADFLQFFTNLKKGFALLKWFITEKKFRELKHMIIFVMTEIGNVLSVQYYSTTPYRLGNQAIKWSFRPYDCKTREKKHDSFPGFSYNFLRERLAESISKEDHCFDFLVQKQENPCNEPIEDPITEWETKWTKIGSMVIPKQTLNETESGNSYCEDLSFSPWHTLEDYQPIGSINRARKAIYQATSIYRHSQNNHKREEPN